MLFRSIARARMVNATCPGPLQYLLQHESGMMPLDQFCSIDDHDVMMAIKLWVGNEDKILSLLCSGIINRNLFKVRFSAEPIPASLLEEQIKKAAAGAGVSEEEAVWLAFAGEASSRTYDFEDENIKILFKDGSVKDISQVDNALINEKLKGKVKKYYICFYR